MIQAVLFDLDGVIIDTEGIYSEFWGAMGDKYAVGIPDFADAIKGTTLGQILGKYFPADRHQQIVAELRQFEDQMRYALFPGAERLLCQLHSRGIRCAVVTSSNAMKMGHLWQQQPQLRGMFDAIITEEKVQRSKPDPQGYILAAQELGCKPEDCVVVEDSYNGLEAGRRSGSLVIALATTNPASTLQGLADMVLPSIADINIDTILKLK